LLEGVASISHATIPQIMSKPSQTFTDMYGPALAADALLTPFQDQIRQQLAPLVDKIPDLEMHTLPVKERIGAILVIFRPASNNTEFDVTLDVGTDEYILHFDGYEIASFTEYEQPLTLENDIPERLYDELVAAFSGKIKIKVTTKKQHPYKWALYAQQKSGEWELRGTLTDFTTRFFQKKTIIEKSLHLL
jgi:hypothetical protein